MKRKMIVFSAIYGLLFIGTNMVHAITPAFFQSMGYPSAMFGIAFACMSLSNFLISPFWGERAGKIGYAKCFAFGAMGYTAGQIWFGLSHTPLLSALARLITGLFVSSFSISGVLYVSELGEKDNGGKYVAYLAAVQTACSAAGYFLGGMLGTISFSAAFAGQAILCIMAAMLAVTLVHEPKRHKKTASKQKLNPLSALWNVRGLLNAYILTFFAAAMCASFTTNCFDNAFNYYIRDQFAFPTSYNGIIKASVGLLGLVVNLFFNPWLAQKGNLRNAIIVVFSAGTVALMLLPLSQSITAFIVLAVVYYTISAAYLPIHQTLGAENGGTVYGAYMSVRSFGQMIGGLLAGLFYALNEQLPFYASAIAFLLAVVFSVVNARQNAALH